MSGSKLLISSVALRLLESSGIKPCASTRFAASWQSWG
jgi:hypothetical protein